MPEAEVKFKCKRDHEKYPELKNAITDLLLKGDGRSCTPTTLRKQHKDLCDIFEVKSFANQFNSTKNSIKRKLEQNKINLGGGDSRRTKQPFGPGPPYQERGM